MCGSAPGRRCPTERKGGREGEGEREGKTGKERKREKCERQQRRRVVGSKRRTAAAKRKRIKEVLKTYDLELHDLAVELDGPDFLRVVCVRKGEAEGRGEKNEGTKKEGARDSSGFFFFSVLCSPLARWRNQKPKHQLSPAPSSFRPLVFEFLLASSRRSPLSSKAEHLIARAEREKEEGHKKGTKGDDEREPFVVGGGKSSKRRKNDQKKLSKLTKSTPIVEMYDSV